MLPTPTAQPETSGPWSLPAMESYLLHATIPIRLGTSGSTGPIVQSMWFDYQDGRIWCSTQSDAVIVRRLRRDPRVGYEVAPDDPPYHGVRGRATADIVQDVSGDVLDRLIAKYLDDPQSGLARWLRSRATTEVSLRLTPVTMRSWDYSSRMT